MIWYWQAAAIAGVDRVFTIGGAQAVAAVGLRYRDCPGSRQNSWAGQYLRGDRQAHGIWACGNRYDRWGRQKFW